MPDNGNQEPAARRADRDQGDPLERVRKVIEEIRPEWEASRERSQRALAELDAALELRSR
ncbi:MAG TPA: hypothetical protein VFZ19_04895 [Solirubrobacterales bacterium]